jgi:hypothetical protein
MKKLIIIAILLTTLASCEKNCYDFKCTDIVTSSNGMNTTTTVTSVEKCNLTSKDAKNVLNAMNGSGSVTVNGQRTTFTTSCSSSVN